MLTPDFLEAFRNRFFIKHLWETAYFMYKFKHFSQHIQQLFHRYCEIVNSLKKLIPSDVASCQSTSLRKKTSRIFLYVFCLYFLRTHSNYFFRRGFQIARVLFLSRNLNEKWCYLLFTCSSTVHQN